MEERECSTEKPGSSSVRGERSSPGPLLQPWPYFTDEETKAQRRARRLAQGHEQKVAGFGLEPSSSCFSASPER